MKYEEMTQISLFFMIFISTFLIEEVNSMTKIIKIEDAQNHKVLKTPAKQVSFPLSDQAKKCIDDLKKINKETPGVGLAAPQINQHLRIFIISISEEAAAIRKNAESYPLTVYINPQYKPIGDKKIFQDFEGCFSVGNLCGWVPRYEEILFHSYNEKGQETELTAKGFLARVLQHETDHLDGILISDRLTGECTKGPFKEMLKIRRNSLSPEKRKIFNDILKQQELDD